MKRRTFIKFLAGLPLIGSLPVLAKPNGVNLDDYQIISKVFDGEKSVCGGFTLGAPRPNNDFFLPSDKKDFTMWCVKDQQVISKNAVVWPDTTGNGNHLYGSGFSEVRKFDTKHTEKENEEIIKAMARGEPESYYKRFRGYKKGLENE